jgi:hypothetical protein
MEKLSPSFNEIFTKTALDAFSFLVNRRDFEFCDVWHDPNADPRDLETKIRYRSPRVFVDIVLTEIDLGLFVFAWRIPTGAARGACWALQPTGVVNFDLYLQDHFGDSLPPLFLDLKKPIYLTEMYNQQSRKYARLLAARLPEAIRGTAGRLEKYGSELLDGVPSAFA